MVFMYLELLLEEQLVRRVFKKKNIIVKFDGKEVTTYKSFLTELYSKEPGDKVSAVVNRNGTEKTIEVTLGEQ